MALPPTPDLEKRALVYTDGYRAAWKNAIAYLHKKAGEMNDPHAAQVLNAAAYDLSVVKGHNFPKCRKPARSAHEILAGLPTPQETQ